MRTIAFSLLGACSLLCTLACQNQGSRDPFLVDLTVIQPERPTKIDDVIVWPVRNDGAALRTEELDSFRGALRRELIDRKYSVLSDSVVLEKAGPAARRPDDDRDRSGTVARAVSVAKELEAHGVLLIWLRKFDDLDLGTEGRVRSEGDLRLIGPDGRDLWKGSFNANARLIQVEDSLPPSTAARRPLAIERLAAELARRLPDHQN